ncbi:olfactory receptor 5AR1-like isoform X2 [Heteronotia binoei]|uniref:olfactory receptor 5AR1-like isoform X2 n=1 Tax=Heteronotia binoei TaxID=13085 RepID=UPI00292E4623|nr:olfactory receptor 5AR1-like isoform X2 [Heteronotia binoei]
MFILMGITDRSELQVPLFIVFLIVYIMTLVGNFGMITLIRTDSRFHTPMYYFLSHLSFLDACYSSVVSPKMLANFLAVKKVILFPSCAAQLFFYTLFAATECYLLAAMAYDRYVAICNPLLYMTVMSHRVCVQLVAGSYVVGLVNAMAETASIFQLSFCGPNIINHFFCDIPPMVRLSCSSTYISEVIIFILATTIILVSTLIILMSYFYIVTAIIQINSATGRFKAFSTCASHLTAVTMFHGTLLFMYMRPKSQYSTDQDKMASIFYTLMIPMLNPLIYSLRNTEVKNALKRSLEKKNIS